MVIFFRDIVENIFVLGWKIRLEVSKVFFNMFWGYVVEWKDYGF